MPFGKRWFVVKVRVLRKEKPVDLRAVDVNLLLDGSWSILGSFILYEAFKLAFKTNYAVIM